MSVMLYGVCGCCNGLTSEYQVVYAYAAYWMGYEGFEGNGIFQNGTEGQSVVSNRLNSEFPQTYPDQIYLTYTETIQLTGGSTYIRTSAFDTTGVLTVADGWPADWRTPLGTFKGTGKASDTEVVLTFDNGTITETISNIYTLLQAITTALGYLDQVALLSPDATYQVTSIGFGAPYPRTFTAEHFCYPSEAAKYPGQACVNTLVIGPDDADGHPVVISSGYTAFFPTHETIYTGPADTTGNPGSWRGVIPSSVHSLPGGGFGGALDGFVCVKKMAMRSPTGFTREIVHPSPLEAHGAGDGSIINFANIQPGENLFLPADAPMPGWVIYDAGVMPPLPPP